MVKYNVCCLDTVQRYKSNILYYTRVSDTSIVNAGVVWYRDANKLCKDIASKTGLKFTTVAGVIAVLSPNQNWQVQQKYTLRFIQDIQKGTYYKSTGYGYFTNRLKAVNMILSDTVKPYLRGAKVEAFYNNITGNLNTVTLDIWAIRIALNDLTLPKKDSGLYMRNNALRDEIYKAYLLASSELNYKPAILQSLVWHIVRDNLKHFNSIQL